MYKAILSLFLLIVVLVVFYLAIPPEKSEDRLSRSSYQEDFSDWVLFIPASGVFQVSLPTSPHYFDSTIDIPFSPKKGAYEIYASTKVNETLFMVSSVIYPGNMDLSDSQETLKALVEQLSHTRPGNRIIHLQETQFDRYPALDFLVDNQNFKIEGIAFLMGQRAYILTYIARKSDFNSREYEHFIHSFSLLKPSVS